VGESCLAVIADGLGGHPCGDRASRLAVEHLLAAKPTDSSGLVNALHEANELIYAEMERTDGCVGMGTTIAAVLVGERGLTVANVGDRAVFELIDGRLVQLSVDDVPPGRGDLPGLPLARVTQTLGGQPRLTAIDPHVYDDDVVGTDRCLLLCTDGLTNFVPRSQIAQALDSWDGAAIEMLINSALVAGGRDNVTIVVVLVSGTD
jgi:protein phosphatase